MDKESVSSYNLVSRVTSPHCRCVAFTKVTWWLCSFLAVCVHLCVCARAPSHVRLSHDPMDHSPLGASVCGIFQARISSFSSVTQSCLTDCLQTHGLQHARPPCPPPTPGVYSNSHRLSQRCHPTISSSVIPFSCPQSFPVLGSFSRSQFFPPGGQSIGFSASTSVLPMNTWD